MGQENAVVSEQPVTVSLDAAHVQWLDDELPLTMHQIQLTINKGSNGYEVETRLRENKEKIDLPAQNFATLPATIKTDAGTLTLTENKLAPKQAKAFEDGYTLKVSITPPSKKAAAFISKLSAKPPSKKVMNMLNLSLEDENIIRSIDFVSHMVENFRPNR